MIGGLRRSRVGPGLGPGWPPWVGLVGIGLGLGWDWVGIGLGLGWDWVGIGLGLGWDWVGIGLGLGWDWDPGPQWSKTHGAGGGITSISLPQGGEFCSHAQVPSLPGVWGH